MFIVQVLLRISFPHHSFFTARLLTRLPFFCLAYPLFIAFEYSVLAYHIIMVPSFCAFLLGAASIVAARPVVEARTVTSLDQAATAEAQQRDNTATRAFSGVPIKVSDSRTYSSRWSTDTVWRRPRTGSASSSTHCLEIFERT